MLVATLLILPLVCARPPEPAPPIREQLRQTVDRYAADSSWLLGIAVYSLKHDSLLFASNDSCALTPASNQKLLTLACALDNWDSTLVRAIETRLRKSRLKTHQALVDSAAAETLDMNFPTGPAGHRYLVWTGRRSDNRLADWLARAMCRSQSVKLQELVNTLLDSARVPRPGLTAIDGSGRSPRNRVAPITLVMLLRAMHRSELRDLYRDLLPEPGLDGTLIHKGLGLGHRLRAKTGYIKATFALSGYLSAETDTFAFSFLANNCPHGRSAYRLFTRLLLALYHWNAADTVAPTKETGAATPPR